MMNNRSQNTPLEIRLLGEAAFRVLSTAGQGSVMASVTNALYLQNQFGELCWLISMDAPMHQRALKVVDQLPRIGVGSKYQVADQSLAINLGEPLDFHQSQMWKEPNISNKDIVPILKLSESLHFVAGQLLTQHHPAGLGCLIEPILQMAIQRHNSLPPSINGRIAEKAWPEVSGMIQANLDQDNKLLILHAKSLVGFGEGLTPSGDDFLGGFFYSMLRLQKHYLETVKLPVSINSNIIHQFKPLTNLLSYTILQDHAEGHSIEPLHQLADGILAGVSASDLIEHAKRLISLGHSTGWDLLAGFYAGMAAAFVH